MEIEKIIKEPLISDSELNRVEIFVLHHSEVKPTRECLESILTGTDWPYKLTMLTTDSYPKGVLAKVYNKLLDESTCDYVAFVCSDATVDKGWLSMIMKNFKGSCVVPLVSPPINPKMNPGRDIGLVSLNADELSISVSVFNKNDIKKIGGFNEDFYLYGHDVDLLQRMQDLGMKFFINTSAFARHDSGTTTKRLFTKEELLEVDNYNKTI